MQPIGLHIARTGLLACALWVVQGAAAARADIPVLWDCFVESGPVNCTTLERSFFSSLADLRRAEDPESATATRITVRSVAARAGTHYVASFAGATDGPAFTMREFVRNQLDADAAQLLLGFVRDGAFRLVRTRQFASRIAGPALEVSRGSADARSNAVS